MGKCCPDGGATTTGYFSKNGVRIHVTAVSAAVKSLNLPNVQNSSSVSNVTTDFRITGRTVVIGFRRGMFIRTDLDLSRTERH